MSPHTLRATSYCFIKSAVKHEYRCTGSITDSTVIPLILSDRETINSDSLLLVPMFLLLDQFFLLISQSTQNSLGVGVGWISLSAQWLRICLLPLPQKNQPSNAGDGGLIPGQGT